MPWWSLWLWLKRPTPDDPVNLATNTATPAPGQTVPTYLMTAADPIDPTTGEMTLQFPVVTVSGCGLDLSFSLSYRSAFGYNGPVGQRWEHNFNARFKYGSSKLTLYAHNRQDIHDLDSGDLYVPPAGFATVKYLKKSTDGGGNRVDRRLRDGTIEVYRELDPTHNANWYFLTEVQHRDSDNKITLTYDDLERLTALVDTRSKSFSMTYDGSSHVSTFEDKSNGGSIARAWTFTYSGNDLTKITAPGSRHTKFVYTGSSLLQKIIAPREAGSAGDGETPYLVNTYDSATPHPRVTAQQLGGGSQTFGLEYAGSGAACTESDREGGRRIFEWKTATREITRIRREVTLNSFVDTLMEWNSEYPTKVTYPAGNGVQMRYDGTSRQLTAAISCNSSGIGESSGTSLSTLRASANFLVTEYTYQSEEDWNMVTKIKDPAGSEWSLGRDATGNVTSYTTPQHTGDPYVIAYDSKSRVETIDDPEGRRVEFKYHVTTGTLSKVVVDPTGGGALALGTTLTRDLFENVITVKDAEDRGTTYARNALGFVTKVITPLGAETDYLYDLNDVVTEVKTDVVSGTEHVVTYTRNIMDLVTEKVESSKTTGYGYDKNDHLTLVTLPVSSRKVKHVYDLRGHEIARIVGYGSAVESTEDMLYDANGQLTTRRDGLDNATAFAYDGFGRVATVTDPEGHYTTKTFDKNGNMTQTSAYASGATELSRTAYEVDANNRQTKIKRHATLGGSTVDTTFVFDKSGKLTAKTDGCGCGTGNVTYAYDKGARLTKIVDAATNEVVYSLDKSGLVTKVTNLEKESGTTRTYVVEYTYDADGRLSQVADKGGGAASKGVIDYDRDLRGNATKITDANSNEVLSDFDIYGRLTKVRRGSGSYVETRTAYDYNDNVTQETSERGTTDSTTSYSYDDADRLSVMTDEEGGPAVKTLVYDAASNVVNRTDGNSSAAVHTYDKRNLVTQIDYTLGSNVVGPTKVKFSYDGLGRVTFAINQRGTNLYDARVKRTWTVLSKLASETLWVDPASDSDGASPSRTISYTYDSSGRVEYKAYADGTTVKLEYDALNRVTVIKRDDPTSGTTWVNVASWTFQGPRRMTQLEFGNGVKEKMSYDQFGRAIELFHDRPQGGSRVTMYSFKRGYDDGDRVTRERRDYYSGTGTILGGATNYGDVHVYDHQNRLVTVVRGVGSVGVDHTLADSAADTTTDFSTKCHYTLDEGGNRQTLRYDVPGGGSSQVIRKENHSFDLENELTTRDVITYSGGSSSTVSESPTYDGNGSLVVSSVLKVDVHNRIYQVTTAGPDWRYRYDPFGRRVQKRDVSNGGTYWRNFYYDGVNCVSEWNARSVNGTVTEYTVPMWTRIFGPYLVDQLIWVSVDPCGTCGNRVGGFMHLDYLGSAVMGTLEADATIYETYRYDEYGQPYFYDPSGGSLGTSQVDQAYLYTGREWDKDIERYYYRARWYDASSGRFLSRDAIRADSVHNNYTFLRYDPLSNVDPMGDHPYPCMPVDQIAFCNDYAKRSGKAECFPYPRCFEDVEHACVKRASELSREARAHRAELQRRLKEIEKEGEAKYGSPQAYLDVAGNFDTRVAMYDQTRVTVTVVTVVTATAQGVFFGPPGIVAAGLEFANWFLTSVSDRQAMSRLQDSATEARGAARKAQDAIRDHKASEKEKLNAEIAEVDAALGKAFGELGKAYTSALESVCCICSDRVPGEEWWSRLRPNFKDIKLEVSEKPK